MKKQLLCLALALVLVLAALPAAALPARAGETEITGLTVYTDAPPPGERSLDLAPLVSLGYSAHCSILACSWLEEPTGYSSVEPDFVFEDGKTYYAYVVLQADEGFVFRKGAPVESGVDEGFFAFDGITLNGADLLFAASRTFATGDFLRLKFAVTSAPETVKHIRSVSFSFTPPKAGDKASDARANVDFPDGQHCTLTDAGWAVKEFENFYRNLSDDDVFEKGMTYILRAEFAADEGSVFNQGGPWGLTAVNVTGGTPLYEYLSVTNSLDDEGRLLSTGSVAVEFTIAEGSETPDPLFGDVDGDGIVSAADARLALRAAVGLEDYKPGTYEYLVSDVDFSDDITAADARLILRAAVELEDPAEWLEKYKSRQG